jgi:long-chain acyl-CoA synthetase
MTTMRWPLRRAVAVAGDQLAVCCEGHRLTYAETSERCDRLVAGVGGLGIGTGDRVAIVGPNCHRFLELYQALPGAGMVIVPLNQRHTDAELRYALADAGARVVFTGRRIADLPSCVEHVIDLADGYERLLGAAGTPPAPAAEPAEDDLAGLFYTGGTTGASKGVMLSHRNLVANALHFQAHGGFDADTVWLIAAPLFHAAGSIAVLATVWHAGRQVVLASFDPARALDLIEQEQVTATLLVPTMLAALSDEQLARPRDVSTLRTISHGGSPVAGETLRRAHLAFPDTELVHIYGTTETSPIATVLAHEERLLDTPRGRSCGQAAIGVEVAVRAADGATVASGVVGEITLRGANVMQGYWNKPEATAEVLVEGWYRTGDVGYQDDAAYVYLVDRAKDMIVTGGENVYSTEVEDVLYRHPAVLEAAVFAVPDAHWGEAVHAVVVPRHDIDVDELLRHCREAIAGYKVPKRIELRAEPLPKSGAGKVLKRELRAPYWSGRDVFVAGT